MEKKIKYLVIPDVHGRDFWKEPVRQVLDETDAHIVFLGDYHDPYPHEWVGEDKYREISVERFKEIIQLKKDNPKRITLLIGNHDCGYCIGEDICTCRMDYANAGEMEKLFRENRDLFQIAEEADINDKHFIFSHAGILKPWVDRVWGEESVGDDFKVVDQLNNAWLVDDYGILHALGIYDHYRGWGGGKYGSPVWSDIQAWLDIKPEETYGFNIVGHSQLRDKPLIFDTIADLDCRRSFYLDDDGNIRDYATDEIQEKTLLSE